MICWYWILLLVCRPEPQSCSLSPSLRGPPGKFLTLWTRSRRSHYLYIQILYDVFWRLSPLIFNLIFLPNTEGQHDGEHGVGPARLGVHVSGGHRPRLVPLLHQILYFHRIGHGLNPTTLHIGTQDFVLPDKYFMNIKLLHLDYTSCSSLLLPSYLTFRPLFFVELPKSNKSNTFSLYISM